MGLRIFKKGTEGYKRRIADLKREQIEIELGRWLRLTDHSIADHEEILARFEGVKGEATYSSQALEKGSLLFEEIMHEKPSLASVQGNLEPNKVTELLGGNST